LACSTIRESSALGADFLIRLDVIHTGDYFTTIENESSRDLTGTHGATFTFDIGSFGVPNTIDYGYVDAITTLNGRIGLIDDGESWDVFIWGRNITDEGEYIDYFRDFFGSLSATPMTPRTYCLEASYHFK
jgi:iron complex outermembrane receptor protein